MDLQDLRAQIDRIDGQLTDLFIERMGVAAGIAAYKKEHKLPVYDPQREREKLIKIAGGNPGMAVYTDALYSLIFELSRSYQKKLMPDKSQVRGQILSAIEKTDPLFPERPLVACQGVEGAFSQQACEKIFKAPNLMWFNSWEGVFEAIKQGLCRYGVLPLENSTAGSVNKIYDLMMKYDFSIVRSTRVKVDHCLLCNRGVKLADVREIVSHEQALNQCADFLKGLGKIKVTACENTAAAAKAVYESGRTDIAALSSRVCAEIYDLDVVRESVQDQGNNYTRFICISKNLEIYPGANKTSVMMVLPHRPGSLYRVLAKFYALGVNMDKLESRPLPNSDFEFMFYFDLETSIYSEEFLQIFSDLDELCLSMKYLGSYSEVV